jgi:hypothetical protein
MDKWDQEKLERVVAEKHGRPENATDVRGKARARLGEAGC